MGLYNMWGLLSLLAVPLIIVMYLLKQKYKKQTVSSLYLWEKVFLESKSQEPFQKLRKNLLMFLQILSAIILGFALANPYFIGKNQSFDYIVAFDCSLSMQAVDAENGNSRFDNAKNDLLELVGNTPPETSFSLLTLEENPKLLFSGLTEKSEIINILNDLQPTNETADILKSKEILMAEKNALDGGEVVVFSDTQGLFINIANAENIYNNQGENTAVSLLSYVENDDDLTVLTKINIYENDTAEKTVTLFVDDVAFDTVTFTPNDITHDVVFQNIPKNTKMLMVKLSPYDDLTADNVAYTGVNLGEQKKALLVSDNNIFLEKALTLMPSIEVYKTDKENANNINAGYGVYVFDGFVPDKLPDDGNIIILNPTENEYFSMQYEKEIATEVYIKNNTDFPFEKDVNFYLNQAKPIDFNWGKSFIENANGEVYGAYGYVDNNANNQKMVVFSFDILNSDLPLKMEFPILFYYIMNWFFPDNNFGGDVFYLNADTVSAYIVSPSGEKTEFLTTSISSPTFKEIGFYKLVETNESGEENIKYIANNISFGEESDLKNYGENTNDDFAESSEVKTIAYGKSLRNLCLLMVCVLLIVEWWVSCNEN